MSEGIEGICVIDAAGERLDRPAVANIDKHTVFYAVPEKVTFDPVALAERELARRLCFDASTA